MWTGMSSEWMMGKLRPRRQGSLASVKLRDDMMEEK